RRLFRTARPARVLIRSRKPWRRLRRRTLGWYVLFMEILVPSTVPGASTGDRPRRDLPPPRAVGELAAGRAGPSDRQGLVPPASGLSATNSRPERDREPPDRTLGERGR